MIKYFFRLDDIASNMDWNNFYFVIEIFKRYNIKPLIAVIPDVQDPKLKNYSAKENFWLIIKELGNNGWIIGQHGYQHLPKGGSGILKIHNSGEFGGLNFESQKEMISAGRKIMEEKLISPEVFVAPRHSFDENTIKALRQNNFNFISDGIALWPFKKYNIVWLPQILWRPRKGMFGLITVALHTNTMSISDIENIEKFIKNHRDKIGNFKELMDWYGNSGSLKKFFLFFINWPFKFFWKIIFLLKHGISK